MEAGRLRERVTVTRPTVTNDGGSPVPSEPVVLQARVPADIRTASAGRLLGLFASQVQAVATHLVSLRRGISWSIREGDRLTWHDGLEGDRRLDVVGVTDPDGRRREWVVAVTERRR